MSAFLSATVRDAPVVVYAKDRDLRFVMSNTEHARLLGRTPEDVVGRTDGELFGEEAHAVDSVSCEVLSTGVPAISEFPLTLPEGERVFHETIFRLRAVDGSLLGVGGIATDITERRRLEARLSASNADLERALSDLERTHALAVEQEKLASLGRLVAGLSHEINTPLGVALLATSMMSDTIATVCARLEAAGVADATIFADLEAVRESAEFAASNVEQAVALTRSFRDMSADRQVAERRWVTPSEWLRGAVETLRPLCTKHSVDVRYRCTADQRVALASGVVHQILTNLVSNACVHAFEADEGGRRVDVELTLDDESLLLVVADNGRGIPSDIRSKVFEPFYTTRRANGGTGLGLSISHQLATGVLGGTLVVGDAPSGGARFTVRWPVSEPGPGPD